MLFQCGWIAHRARLSSFESMSKIIRRSHMYLALFLSPWLLMYAASTFAMNHRTWFRAGQPVFEKEREELFRGQIPQGARPADIAAQVLRELQMEGAHNVNASPDGQRFTILRQETMTPRRVVFTP